jgi:succinoglycan biosynthesis protein ExoL
MAAGVESRHGRWLGEPQLRLAYLVHNLADPAVTKRVRMLAAFGDEVAPIGFHRDNHSLESIAGFAAMDLGRTFDANFCQRTAMIVGRALNLAAWAPQLQGCDVVIARNLEMITLGALARWRYAPEARLVYEVLDIHRFLLSNGVLGKGMRLLEQRVLRQADVLIVSSPAFLSEYFEPIQRTDRLAGLTTLVVENKMFPAGSTEIGGGISPALRPAAPWRIGWFGMIRCRKSLDYLCDLTTRRPGLLELLVRGKPSYTEFRDFDGQIAGTPAASFGGAYKPADLGMLYADVHFNWAIDFFEEGTNSRWLLPNRIYEGGAYGAVPIAIEGTETANWMRAHGIGVVLSALEDLEPFLLTLTPQHYAQLRFASNSAPRETFIADDRDCRRLLQTLRRAEGRPARAIGRDLRGLPQTPDDVMT